MTVAEAVALARYERQVDEVEWALKGCPVVVRTKGVPTR